MSTKIEEHQLERDVFGMLRSNPKASYQKIADYCNAVLKGREIKDEISAKAVERFIKANEDHILKIATEKQNQLLSISLENQVQIEKKVVQLLDEAEKFFEDLKVRESDSAAVRCQKNILDILKFVAQLTGKLQEGMHNQTNIYNVNFAPSVNQYILDLKKKGKLRCNNCKSTDIGMEG